MEEKQEDLLENIAEGQVYTIRTIVISTLLGSLLAGSYMLYQNFKKFGEYKKARATVMLTIVAFLVLLACAFSPILAKIPGLVYTLVFSIITSLLAQKYQGDLIEKHIAANGKIYSAGRAILICVISVLLLFTLALGAFFMQDMAVNN